MGKFFFLAKKALEAMKALLSKPKNDVKIIIIKNYYINNN